MPPRLFRCSVIAEVILRQTAESTGDHWRPLETTAAIIPLAERGPATRLLKLLLILVPDYLKADPAYENSTVLHPTQW